MNSPSSSFRARALVLAAGLAVAAVSSSGCEDMNRPQSRGEELPDVRTPAAPRNSRSIAAAREQQRREYEQEAADLQAGLEAMNTRQDRGSSAEAPLEIPSATSRTASRGRWNDEPRTRPELDDRTAGVAPAANRSASLPDLSAPGTAASRTPEQRWADAVAELAVQLKPDIAGAKEPLRTAMPLLGLELISPGAGAQYLDSIKRAISPEQRRSLDSASAIFRAMAGDPNLTSGSPADVAQALRAEADRLGGAHSAASETLALGDVALCQRVDGFGRYTPLASNAFFAGRPAAMILYTEIENFSQTSALETPGAGADASKWNVELGQTVRLYLESDASLQMELPETVVRDGSRSKRHDFFLVQRIDLPRTLSVGNYILKITVRDTGGGSPGAAALAERSVPIRIIADASAAGVSSQRGAGKSAMSPAGNTQPGRRGTVADRRP